MEQAALPGFGRREIPRWMKRRFPGCIKSFPIRLALEQHVINPREIDGFPLRKRERAPVVYADAHLQRLQI